MTNPLMMNQGGVVSYQAYVINLDRSADRLSFMAQQLDAQSITWQRIAAVNGQSLSESTWQDIDQARYLRCHGKRVTPGEVGCYCSHIKVMKAFLASTHDHALVLEDDVTLPEQFQALIEAILAHHRVWDLVHLSGYRRAGAQSIVRIDDRHQLAIYLARQTGSGAYLINRYAAQQLLDRLLPMYLPYDHAFNQAWRFGIRQRGLLPLPVDQSVAFVDQSTIDQDAINQGRLPWWQKAPTMRFRIQCEITRFFFGLWQLLRWRAQQLLHKRFGLKGH